jgi:hypothetical protein
VDNKLKRWIEAVLSNDEVSSDEELIEHFMAEGKLSEKDVKYCVSKRMSYLNNLFPTDTI